MWSRVARPLLRGVAVGRGMFSDCIDRCFSYSAANAAPLVILRLAALPLAILRNAIESHRLSSGDGWRITEWLVLAVWGMQSARGKKKYFVYLKNNRTFATANRAPRNGYALLDYGSQTFIKYWYV